MKIFLLILTFTLGIIGWFKPETASVWLQISAVCIMLLALIFEILLEIKTMKEAAQMQSQLAEIHTSETARPAFELSVNGTKIHSREQWISLPEENGQLAFELKLTNIGKATATEVQAFLWVSEEIQIPFLGRHWISNGIPTKPESPNNELVKGVKEYAFVSPVAINVKNWLTLGHGRLPLFQKGVEVPFHLKVYASGETFQEWTFGVKQ